VYPAPLEHAGVDKGHTERVIYEASKGSAHFANNERKGQLLLLQEFSCSQPWVPAAAASNNLDEVLWTMLSMLLPMAWTMWSFYGLN
jgi:hypothetical protein